MSEHFWFLIFFFIKFVGVPYLFHINTVFFFQSLFLFLPPFLFILLILSPFSFSHFLVFLSFLISSVLSVHLLPPSTLNYFSVWLVLQITLPFFCYTSNLSFPSFSYFSSSFFSCFYGQVFWYHLHFFFSLRNKWLMTLPLPWTRSSSTSVSWERVEKWGKIREVEITDNAVGDRERSASEPPL